MKTSTKELLAKPLIAAMAFVTIATVLAIFNPGGLS
jgi:hypothetical protein